jgi:serine/threonine-protein kinase HipA
MVLFNFLVGNEDMHVKNFSIINRDNKIELSPCYDLLNSTIELTKQEEEIALPIKGKKKHLTRNILIDYFGKERCELTNKVIDNVLETITFAIPSWMDLINISFLSADMKKKYIELLNTRSGILKIQ